VSSSPPEPPRTRSWLGQTLLRAQSDERLVALARDGSPAAFAALADRYRAELAGQARHLAGAQAADDVVQQTLTSAWAALRSGTQVGHPRAWLHQIARHAAFQAQRSWPTHAGESALREVSSESAEEGYLRQAGAREALGAIAALPERQRRALELTALRGASARSAARELGVNENALRQAVHRARRTVRRATSAITPYPLLHWALSAGGAETVSSMAAGAGAGTAALVLKGTAAVVAVGVGLGGTAALLHPDRQARGGHPTDANALAEPGATGGPASAGRAHSAVHELTGADPLTRGRAALVDTPGNSTRLAHRHAGTGERLRHETEAGDGSDRAGAHREDAHHQSDRHEGTHRDDGAKDSGGGNTSAPEPSGDHPSSSSDAGTASTDSPTEHGDTATALIPSPVTPAHE
jgi:RNA polymerase sigma-70 factor (ECF subfamily)